MAKRDFNLEPDTNKVGLMDGGFAAVYRIDALLTRSHELFINCGNPREVNKLSALYECINDLFDEVGAKLDYDDRNDIQESLDNINFNNLMLSKGKSAIYNFNDIKRTLRNIRRKLIWLADNKGLLIPNLVKKKTFIGDME